MSKLVDLNNLNCWKCGKSGCSSGVPCPACGYLDPEFAALIAKEAAQAQARIDGLTHAALGPSKSLAAAIAQASEEHRLQEEFDRNYPIAIRLLRTAASDAAWEKAGLDRPWWELKYLMMGLDNFWGPLPPRDSDK
ncbi:MAG: hypothetical protein L3J02_02745 [Henriciella sp.]|nr:hypothetical protein [Henriciella sp.]